MPYPKDIAEHSLTTQRGQALIMMLGVLAVGVMAWLALYCVTQVASARVRLTHSVDAVAYSGAMAQARSLNLLAYINRAQAVHQIAMAHLATLASLADFTTTQSEQRAKIYPPARLMKSLFGDVAEREYARVAIPEPLILEAQAAFHLHDELVHQVLAKSAISIAENISAFRNTTMMNVLSANYPEWSVNSGESRAKGPVHLSVTSEEAVGFLTHYTDQSDRSLRRHIEKALDHEPVMTERLSTYRSHRLVQTECPNIWPELRRSGATYLDHAGQWVSTDTKSYHPVQKNKKMGCYFGEQPMGWAGVAGNITDRDGGLEQWSRALDDRSPRATQRAYQHARQWDGRGLPAYFDLRERNAQQSLKFSVSLHHSVAVGKKGSGVPRRSTLWPLDDEIVITATSAAETYYVDQHKGDSEVEAASLFQPFWHSRLIARSPLQNVKGIDEDVQ
jgi:hypothetical protein